MFLESTKIKVYPTSYRKSDVGDVNASLMTEKNLTYLKKLSQFEKLNNYFDYNEEEDGYTFNLILAGYHFNFTLDTAF